MCEARSFRSRDGMMDSMRRRPRIGTFSAARRDGSVSRMKSACPIRARNSGIGAVGVCAHVRASSLGLRRTSPLRHNWPHPFDSAHLRGFPWWRCSTRPGIPLFGSRFKRVQAAYSSLPASGAAHGRQDVETEGLKSFCPFCKLHYSHTQRAQSSSAAAVIRLIRARLYSSSLLSSQI